MLEFDRRLAAPWAANHAFFFIRELITPSFFVKENRLVSILSRCKNVPKTHPCRSLDPGPQLQTHYMHTVTCILVQVHFDHFERQSIILLSTRKKDWRSNAHQPMMMIAFMIFNRSLVPLIEGLCSSNQSEFELSGFRRNRTDDLKINNPSLWPTETRLHVRPPKK